MKQFTQLRVFRPEMDGGLDEQQLGLWGYDNEFCKWRRVCECPMPIRYFPIGPNHLQNFTQGHISPLFDCLEIAKTVLDIVNVCRKNAAWVVEDDAEGHSFHLSDIHDRAGLSTLLDTGFVIKNENETYTVARGLVILLVATELDGDCIRATSDLCDQDIGNTSTPADPYDI